MNYLITGADGFIGANFIKYILDNKVVKDGDEIFALLRQIKPDILSPLSLSGNMGNVTPILCDLRDFSTLKDAMIRHEIDVVYHFAAQPIVRIAQKDPAHTIEANVVGTLNIMEAIRIAGIKKVFIMSSDKVYGDENPPYTEDSNIGGVQRIYDASKSAAEILARSYGETFDIDVKVIRSSNIYGPYDLNFSRIIPTVIKEIITTGQYKVFLPSNLEMTREFVYVNDVCKIIHEMMVQPHTWNIYNVGADGEIYIHELCDLIAKVMGEGERVEVTESVGVKEIKNQYMDDSLMRRELDFQHSYDLTEGLKETVEWYREYIKMRFMY